MSEPIDTADDSPLRAAGHTLAPTRRAVLAGAGAAAVAVLAGCATYDSTGGPAPAAPPAGSGGAAGTSGALTAVAKVPVGGGVVTGQGVVVTQPTAGTFLGFSSVCTHQGCTVGAVKDGLITCPCHGSAFKIGDGSVARGPATKPLNPVEIEVVGPDVQLA
jgi:Rieske Fe-S protein